MRLGIALLGSLETLFEKKGTAGAGKTDKPA